MAGFTEEDSGHPQLLLCVSSGRSWQNESHRTHSCLKSSSLYNLAMILILRSIVCMCVNECVCLHGCACVRIHTCTCVHGYVYISMCVCMCGMYMCVFMHMCTYMYMCVCVHICVHVCAHVCGFVCICALCALQKFIVLKNQKSTQVFNYFEHLFSCSIF